MKNSTWSRGLHESVRITLQITWIVILFYGRRACENVSKSNPDFSHPIREKESWQHSFCDDLFIFCSPDNQIIQNSILSHYNIYNNAYWCINSISFMMLGDIIQFQSSWILPKYLQAIIIIINNITYGTNALAIKHNIITNLQTAREFKIEFRYKGKFWMAVEIHCSNV